MRTWVTLTILFNCSCKVADTNLPGEYKAKSYHMSNILLDSNGHFTFSNDGLEFLLNGESRIWTQGTWKRTPKNQLILSSISDSIATPRFEVNKQILTDSSQSEFVFIDPNKDTVLIYTVYKNDKIAFYRSHGPFLTMFKASLSKADTMFFSFTWGFHPVQIPIANDKPTKYVITLNRVFRPNYFRNTAFIIRKNKLIRATDKAKFRKTKSNGI